jgi:Protein of unknown function (DUF1579)
MSEAPAFTPPTPGPEHRVLAKDVGTWDADVVVRMGGGPPQSSRGVSVNRLVCGGLWLVCDFRNETSGFEGHGVFGYDPKKGRYVGTWVDPMRTFLAPMEGTWDAGAKTMTFIVHHEGPRGPVQWRETTQTVDDVTQIFRVFMAQPGAAEAEVMTVTYKRRT